MSSRKSISQYKQELNDISERYGYSGVVKDYIVSVLAYAIYEDQFNIQVMENEADPNKATRINNVIDYAIGRMYSVYRGTNPKIHLKFRSIIPTSFKKNQLIYAGKGFNVYCLNDLSTLSGQEYLMDCIVAKSVNEVIATEDQINAYYVDFGIKDASEDISLYLAESAEYENKSITKILSDLVDNSVPMQITSYDYGVRIYFDEINSRRPIQSYKLIYYPYYQEGITLDDLKKMSISGIEFNYMKDIILENPTQREGLNDGIGDKSKLNLLSLGKIKSNTDMLSMFNLYFSDKVTSSKFIITDKNVIIYYVPKGISRLSDQDANSFIKYMAPYLPCYTEVLPNGGVTYVPIKPLILKLSSPKYYSITVDIYSTNLIDSNIISEYLTSLQYKLGLSVSIYDMMTEISKSQVMRSCKVNIKEMKSSSTSSSKSTNNNESINLDAQHYLLWDQLKINIKK